MHGEVEHISSEKGIKVVSNSGRRPHTWKIKPNQMCQVVPGQTIEECQILASGMPVLNDQELTCSGSLSDGLIQRLLNSREKTQRFTGIKLAKVNGFGEYCEKIREIVEDQEEDIYVKHPLKHNSHPSLAMLILRTS
jgi:hypothetical protein